MDNLPSILIRALAAGDKANIFSSSSEKYRTLNTQISNIESSDFDMYCKIAIEIENWRNASSGCLGVENIDPLSPKNFSDRTVTKELSKALRTLFAKCLDLGTDPALSFIAKIDDKNTRDNLLLEGVNASASAKCCYDNMNPGPLKTEALSIYFDGLLAKQEFKEAEELREKVPGPLSIIMCSKLFDAYFEKELFKDASELRDKAPPSLQSKMRTRLFEARFEREEFKEAEEECEASTSSQTMMRKRLFEAYFERKNFEKAEKQCDKLPLEEQPPFRARLFEARFKRGDLEEASKQCAQFPMSPESTMRKKLLDFHFERKNFSEAANQYQELPRSRQNEWKKEQIKKDPTAVQSLLQHLS